MTHDRVRAPPPAPAPAPPRHFALYDVELDAPMTADQASAFLFEHGTPPPLSTLEAIGTPPTRTWTVGGPRFTWDATRAHARGLALSAALRDDVRDAIWAQAPAAPVRHPAWFAEATREIVERTNRPPAGADVVRVPDDALQVYVWRDGDVWYRLDTSQRNLQAFHREPGLDRYNAWVSRYIEQGLDITDAMDRTVADLRDTNIAMLGAFATALSSAAAYGRPSDLPTTPTIRPQGPDVPPKPPAPDVPLRVPEEVPAPKPTKAPERAPKTKPKKNPTADEYRPCFIAGTAIETPDGAVAIERLTVGAAVLTRVAPTQRTSIGSVTACHMSTTRTLVRVVAHDGDLWCTRQHRFYVRGDGWLTAEELTPGVALETLDGEHAEIHAISVFTSVEPRPTFDLDVAPGSSYFVALGRARVLVHNGGDPYARRLYWYFGKLQASTTDFDGMSVWRTDTRAQVIEFFRVRVKEMNRGVTDVHGYFAPADLEKAGLVAQHTPDPRSPLTKAGLDHHSVRDAANPNPSVKLTASEIGELNRKLERIEKTIVKPLALHGEC